MSNRFEILELRFSNVKCFREDNCIDFRKNVKNDIIEIIEPSGYGKTAIVWAIAYCLYGKQLDGRNTAPTFNKRGKRFMCSLMIKKGDNTYLIKRTGTVDYEDVKVSLYHIKSNKYTNIQNAEYNIQELCGSLTNFLVSSSFITSINELNFIDMNPIKRNEYLNLAPIAKINKAANSFLTDQKQNMVIKLVDNANGIKLNIGGDFDSMYDIRTCSMYEKIVYSLALKYAFMKVLPVTTPNIFIIDVDYRMSGMICGNEKKFQKMFDQIKQVGTNVMIIHSSEDMQSNNAFKISISHNRGTSVVNNVGKIKNEGMYTNNNDGEIEYEDDTESEDNTASESDDTTTESD